MSAPPTFSSAYAKEILGLHLLKKFGEAMETTAEALPVRRPRLAEPIREGDPPVTEKRICIVGAGAAGLYMAMMLKY